MNRVIKTPEGFHVLEQDTHLSRWIENHKRLDVAAYEIGQFAKYIPVGGVVVDAGACLGDHAITYAKLVGQDGRVFAFEPAPLTYEALALNFEGIPNVTTLQTGLSDFCGSLKMAVNKNAGASQMSESGETDVLVVTLDSLNLAQLDFMHLDCEGCELRVLRGARQTILDCQPVIVLEINHDCLRAQGTCESDIIKELVSLDYAWQELHPDNGPRQSQRDILAFPL